VVVRRLKTRIGDRIDIGVEYVGQNPRGVTMALDTVPVDGTEHAKRTKEGVFTALYLRESARQPVMPFKTLIMSTATSSGNRRLTLRSANAEYIVRLKEPIEEQDEFVWLPYEVLERRASSQPPQPADDSLQFRVPAKQPTPSIEGTPSDWLMPHIDSRVESAA